MHFPAHASWPAAFPRSFRKQYPRAVRGEGAWIFDEHGKKYLDLAGSAAVSFLGHGDPAIARAMAAQVAAIEFAHTSQFVTPIAEDFARELLEFAGAEFGGGAVYFTSGGSEAVETALKLARQFQVESGHDERYQVISRQQSYHGATLGAMAVSGNLRRRKPYLPMLREFSHINTPYCYRCAYGCNNCAAEYARELEIAISESGGTAAAFICEPISGATLGAAVPPGGYLQEIRRICNAHGLLWIADEVMTGCGRTGRNLAWEHWDNVPTLSVARPATDKGGATAATAPDIVVAGKGLAAGYAPLGAVIASRRVVEAIAAGSGAFIHGLTYNAHPVSVAAGRAVLNRVRELRLVEAADSNAPGSLASEFAAALQTLRDCDCVGDVRGLGLLWGVEFVADRQSKTPYDPESVFSARVFEAAQRRGVLVYPMQGCVDGTRGDHLLLAPPAVASPDEIRDGIAELRRAIYEVQAS
ncbi:MAG: aminotransferase class III-fold pyridoxal phosphate-dependent enzyme [Acidobacteriia bacterium]|nr:aminotransferase class III-fold pyridoxal phosphate-dependent enzyme [Terriglobia bacterium]